MKRKFIFLITLIFALGGVKSSLLNAQENQEQEVIIGDGTATTNGQYIPVYIGNSNRYAISQQIYLASEIKKKGTINKISFYTYQNLHERNIEVYIVHTTKTKFSLNNDWETLSSSDKVFGGVVEFGSGSTSVPTWVTITFDENFSYDGTSNLLLCVYDKTGDRTLDSNYPRFYTHNDGTGNYMSLYKTNTSSIDPTNLSTINGTRRNQKNYIKFTFTTDSGEGGEEETSTPPTAVTDPKLNGLTPSESAIYGNPTTLSWTWGENTNSYQVLVGTEKENETTVKNTLGQQETQEFDANANSYILNNLAPKTTYYWQVKSSNDNGEAYSDIWQFTTVNAAPTEMVTKTAPANAASVKKSNLSFSWTNANTNHTRYTIYYKENVTTSEWAELYSASSTNESYNPTESDFAKLKVGKTYLWRVDVNNAIYKSEDTEPWSFTLLEAGNIAGTVYDTETKTENGVSTTNNIAVNLNKVTISQNGEVKAEAVINNTNEFTFSEVATGTYDLTVTADGYSEYVYEGVEVRNNETNNITIYMPTILDLNGGWINPNYAYTNGNLSENNEVIVRANAIMPQNNITIKTLTIEDGNSLTISNGSTLTVTGKINKANNANNLIIEDGGQLFYHEASVQTTFNMNIINPTDSEGNLEWSEDNKNGWQFISSPFTNAAISQFVPATNNGDYDLYKFNGSQVGAEWQNIKATAFENNFAQGRAYLVSYETQTSATLSGNLNNGKTFELIDGTFLSYTAEEGKELANFYLIGNPFPFDMVMSNTVANYMVKGYAEIGEDGEYDYKTFTDGIVKAGDGFFIKTTEPITNRYPTFNYNHYKNSSKSRSEEAASINLIATGNNGSDNLIISLSGAENEGFNKLENFNKDIATVFVVKNDTRYGIANFDNDVTMIDVAFEATQMGNYTISAQPNGKFKSLTLVDRFTGIETDLLVEDYNFTATSNDNYNRFLVKLEANSQEPTANGNFAYVSGEELILNIEGAVEIIDMMGRIIYANDIIGDNNRIDVSAFNNAAYVVRVINENRVKVQKIIL